MFLFVGYAMALEIIPIFLYDDAWRDALLQKFNFFVFLSAQELWKMRQQNSRKM